MFVNIISIYFFCAFITIVLLYIWNGVCIRARVVGELAMNVPAHGVKTPMCTQNAHTEVDRVKERKHDIALTLS